MNYGNLPPYDPSKPLGTSFDMCRQCETLRSEHLDDGTCLFAPTRFAAMTSTEYLALLMRPLSSHEARKELANVAAMPTVPVSQPFGGIIGGSGTIGYYSPSTTDIVYGRVTC